MIGYAKILYGRLAVYLSILKLPVIERAAGWQAEKIPVI